MPARLSARTDEEWLQGDEVALAKRVRDAAGDADRRWVRLDQLGRKRINRVAVAAASAVGAASAAIAASVTMTAPKRRVATADCAVMNRFTTPCPA